MTLWESITVGATFDQEAIPKCFDRLEKARAALFHARNGVTAEAFRSAYGEFLLMTGSLLHVLEAGSRDTPQGRQWYGGKKRLGRSDDLLRYMHQARNVEEHTKDYAALMDPGRIQIGAPIDASDSNGSSRHTIAIGNQVLLDMQGPAPKLLPVLDDRYNQLFGVPTSHMGRPLPSSDPISVGEAYLAYLDLLVAEAASLA